MPRMEFETMIAVFKQMKVCHALGRTVTVIGMFSVVNILFVFSFAAISNLQNNS